MSDKGLRLEGARVLITGAAGGIGSNVAERLARSGASLLLTDLRAEPLEVLAERLRRTGRAARIVTVAADVTSATGRAELVANARDMGVDVLINVAGINPFGLVAEQTPADIERTLLINTTAPMLLCQALLPVLSRADSAHIVNVGSTFGSIGFAGFCAYSASKFAIRGFTEALRRELADTPIHVHYVAPRATRTALNTGRVQALNSALGIGTDTPHTVARAIERALVKGRRETYLGAAERLFTKVNALFPGLVDGALRKQLPIVLEHASVAPDAPRDAGGRPIKLGA